ncbi:hypothetical protein AB4Z38_12030 [Arthrobacter sp. 2RAF6]|uniref:hypothetical protein n=1 Tax=Arthrobacter sp. 2RAF6 TaxID=3233002 RepID=UPI003F8FC381
MDIEALMDRATELKAALVDYATTPGFARRLSQAVTSASGSESGRQDAWAEAVEALLYEPGPDGREPLLDRYLRTNKTITLEDRSAYEDWRDHNVYGAFRVDTRRGAGLTLHNLIDEMDYRTYATVGADAISKVKSGGYVITRLVPIGDIWTISGNLRIFGPKDLPTVRALAVSLLEHFPSLLFRNAAKAESARNTVQKHHAIFVKRFGSHVIRGTGPGAIAAYRGFLDACSAELAAGDSAVAGLVLSGEQLAPDGSFPPELAESDDVALYHHPVKSVSFLVRYGEVEDAHGTPSADPASVLIRQYLEDSTIPPYVLEDLAGRFPDTVDEVYRAALSIPDFEWHRDCEDLLSQHKAEYYRDADLPGITPVPVLLLDEYRRQAKAGGSRTGR